MVPRGQVAVAVAEEPVLTCLESVAVIAGLGRREQYAMAVILPFLGPPLTPVTVQAPCFLARADGTT